MGRIAPAGLIALAAAVAAGCNSNAKMAAQAGPYATQVASAIPRLEKSIGLAFKSPPKLETRTRDEVRAFLEQRFQSDLPTEEVDGMARAYRVLGMLPDTLDLRKFMLELLTEQVAGYYDPGPKTLYVVQDAPPEVVDITVKHELVHALQDQYVNLDSIQKQRADNDRQVAAQSVIEGQATLEQLGGINLASALPGGWERVRQLIRENQQSMPVFTSAPLVLQETMLFPYLSGAEFVRRFKEKSPDKPPYPRMPQSTEQIMHPEKFLGDAPDEPTTVVLPAPAYGKKIYENNLGEFETRLFLFEQLRDLNASVRGSAGWDGDRYVLVQTPRGDAIAWVTVWDTAVDAAEFVDNTDTGLLKKYGGLRPAGASRTTRSYGIGGGRAVHITVGDVGGRPVVLFANVPSGMSGALVDLKKVTLQE